MPLCRTATLNNAGLSVDGTAADVDGDEAAESSENGDGEGSDAETHGAEDGDRNSTVGLRTFPSHSSLLTAATDGADEPTAAAADEQQQLQQEMPAADVHMLLLLAFLGLELRLPEPRWVCMAVVSAWA
jgi:hypothetical protein